MHLRIDAERIKLPDHIIAAGVKSRDRAIDEEECCRVLIHVRQWRRWCQPFVWIGMNPILLYLSGVVVSYRGIAQRLAGGDVKAFLDQTMAQGGELVLMAIKMAVMIGLARFLYQRKIFLRV